MKSMANVARGRKTGSYNGKEALATAGGGLQAQNTKGNVAPPDGKVSGPVRGDGDASYARSGD